MVREQRIDNEWYTPPEFIRAAAAVMGGIDIDPASSATANEVVQAEVFYTAKTDGLQKSWAGRIWLNPPYEEGLLEQFAAHLLGELHNGHVTQACALLANSTESEWFQDLAGRADALYLPRKPLRFWHPAGKVQETRSGHIVFYFGERVKYFHEYFSALDGVVAIRRHP